MSHPLARREGLLTCAWYGAAFFAFGAHLPYWPVWLEAWGLSPAEIASYLGLAMVVRIAGATLVPAMADRFAIRRALLAAAAAIAAAAFLAHAAIGTRTALLGATLLAALATAPLLPLGEALGVRASSMHGFAYAHARVVGSATFLASNAALGLAVARLGPDVVLWLLVPTYAVLAVLGLAHPGGGAPPGTGVDRSKLRETLRLAAHPTFLAFAFAASLIAASHAVLFVYGTLGWRAQGIGTGTIGLLWATGVLAEIALMLGPGRRLVERLGPARALALAAAAGVLRWAAMALEPPVALLWPVQALHAFTFAVAHLGAMAFFAAAVPPRLQASAQGLQGGGLAGGTLALAALAAGQIADTAGLQAAYWLPAALCAGGLAASALMWRLWDGRRID